MQDPSIPRPGDLLSIGSDASVQFARNPFIFLLIRVHGWTTYDGWIWLDGFELATGGTIVQRRSIFVRIAGIHLAPAGHPRPDAQPYIKAVARQFKEPDLPRRTT